MELSLCLSVLLLALGLFCKLALALAVMQGRPLGLRCFKSVLAPVVSTSILILMLAGVLLGLPTSVLPAADLFLSLAIISAVDLKRHMIPNLQLFLLVLTQLVLSLLLKTAQLHLSALLAALLVLGCMVLVSFLSKGQFGLGDAKLLTVAVLICGLSASVYALLGALLMMLLFSLPCLLLKKLTLRTQLPFAPFFTVGLAVSIFLL